MSYQLKHLTGREVLVALKDLGFDVVATLGNQVKMERILAGGKSQILTLPIHRALDLGTVRAVFRQASRFVQEAELRRFFFNDERFP